MAAGDLYRGFLTFQARGVITVPAALRERLGASVRGARIEVVEREDGVFELRPFVAVPADQAWFWSRRWQAMEREADEDIAAGRVATFDDVDAFLADLDE